MKLSITLEQVRLNLLENHRNLLRGLVVVSLNLTIFGCFVLLYSNLVKITADLADINQHTLLIFNEIDEEDYARIASQIRDTAGVYQVKTYTADEARVRFIETLASFEESVHQFSVQDFPRLIEFKLPAAVLADQDLLQNLQQNPFVIEVLGGEQTIAQVNVFFQLVKVLGVIFSFFLALVVFWVTSNAMQINLLNHLEELRILQILGAQPSFIRRPCLIEGIILCLLSTVLAWLVVYVLYLLAIAALTFNEATAIVRTESHFFSMADILLALVGMAVMGVISSWRATTRVFELLNSTKN